MPAVTRSTWDLVGNRSSADWLTGRNWSVSARANMPRVPLDVNSQSQFDRITANKWTVSRTDFQWHVFRLVWAHCQFLFCNRFALVIWTVQCRVELCTYCSVFVVDCAPKWWFARGWTVQHENVVQNDIAWLHFDGDCAALFESCAANISHWIEEASFLSPQKSIQCTLTTYHRSSSDRSSPRPSYRATFACQEWRTNSCRVAWWLRPNKCRHQSPVCCRHSPHSRHGATWWALRRLGTTTRLVSTEARSACENDSKCLRAKVLLNP